MFYTMHLVLYLLVVASFGSLRILAQQRCGRVWGERVCSYENCCSKYGWCDSDFAHCNPNTCQPEYSGRGSSCRNNYPYPRTLIPVPNPLIKTPKATPVSFLAENTVPNIDVCGAASSAVSCPGAGINGYFYRCCSSYGHCGPKNNIQDQDLYCGTGCQGSYGKCDSEPLPPNPSGTPGVAQNGDTCGPIVNMQCAAGLCCSGSNYCGTGVDFCGSANWCQPSWGECS